MSKDDINFFKQIKKALIIEARLDIRGILREVVKEIGISDIVIANTIEEAWDVLETQDNPPDWIISSLELDSKVNIFHLLSLIIDQPDFINTRVSLLIKDDIIKEKEVLPLAFELGILSWHVKPFTKASIKNSFLLINDKYVTYKGSETLVAADFLREYFTNEEKFEDLITLENALIAQFPEEANLLIKLAEAQYGAKKYEEAQKTLIQAKYLGGNILKSAEQLEEIIKMETQIKPFEEQTPTTEEQQASFAKVFEVDTAVVVDPDNSICNLIELALKELGFSNINIFYDGLSALQWLESNPAPHAIIQEWKLPKVSGVALVQRIRQIYTNYVPIFIISSLLKKEDLSLLKEIGISAIIEKPPQKSIFIATFTNVIKNEKRLSNAESIENLIRQALFKNNLDQAKKLFTNYVTLNPEESNKKIFEAEIALAEKNYELAKELAMEAFRLKADTVLALNTLGKILLKVGDTESAIKCFTRAKELSPKNLERLCLLSEAYSETGNKDTAEDLVKQAKSIDDKNPLVIETEAKIAIASGNITSAKEALSKLNSFMNVIAYMNNRAVIAVKQGQIKESLDLYYKALDSLPSDHPKEESILLYNLALAYIRLNKAKEALKVLEKIHLSKLDDKNFANKISSLLQKLKSALAKGKKIQMNLDTDKISEASLLQKGGIDIIRPMALHIKPNDMRLHLIYTCKSACYEKFMQYFKNKPKFSSHIHQTILRPKTSTHL